MNMQKIRGRVPEVLMLVCSILLAAGSVFWFPVCGPKEDGSYMLCHWAGHAVTAVSVLSLVLSALCLACRSAAGRMAYSVSVLLSAVLTAVIPGNLIPLCLMPGMQCRSHFRPAVLILGGMLAVLAAVSAAQNGMKRKTVRPA